MRYQARRSSLAAAVVNAQDSYTSAAAERPPSLRPGQQFREYKQGTQVVASGRVALTLDCSHSLICDANTRIGRHAVRTRQMVADKGVSTVLQAVSG